MIDLGTFLGGFVFGFLIDKTTKKSIILIPLIAFSSFTMFYFQYMIEETEVSEYYIFAFLIGLFHGSPTVLVNGTISIDLANSISTN
jgi:MFS family permease